jgi:hypothetical protein
MATYASGTSVSVEKSQAEIRKEVQRFGATHFSFSEGPGFGRIEFVVGKQGEERWVRFDLRLPMKSDERFWRHRQGRRTAEGANKQWEQACRESWRALLLLVKAKLAGVSAKITTVEEEFLAHTVDPATDRTVYQQIGEELTFRVQRSNLGLPPVEKQPLRLPGPLEPDEVIDPPTP